MECHHAAQLSVRTAAVCSREPHHSPHDHETPDYTRCQVQHEKTEAFCTQCHKSEFQVP